MTYEEALQVECGEVADADLLRLGYAARNFSPTADALARIGISAEAWRVRNAALLQAIRGAEVRRAEANAQADAPKRAAQARRASRQGGPARVRCERCGVEHAANQMMRGSRQVLCPECYDRVEAAL